MIAEELWAKYIKNTRGDKADMPSALTVKVLQTEHVACVAMFIALNISMELTIHEYVSWRKLHM